MPLVFRRPGGKTNRETARNERTAAPNEPAQREYTVQGLLSLIFQRFFLMLKAPLPVLYF